MTHHHMRRFALVLGCSILLPVLPVFGQLRSEDALQRQGYAPAERTALHTRWVRVVTTNGVCVTNVVNVLAPGQNRFVGGRWVPSAPELVAGPEGQGIIGRGAGHTAWFPTNLTDSGVLIIDQGRRIRLRFAGIAYEGPGTNLLIAEAKPSGAVLGTNTVTYRDATTDFRSTVTYRYSAAGVSQTITFPQRPPPPEAFGLDPATVRLVVLSEIVEGPAEQTAERSWRFGGEIERDQTISFGGSMAMVPGFAFGAERSLSAHRYRVAKQVEHYQGGRRAITEAIPYRQIRRELMKLPPASTGGGTNASLVKPERWFANRLPTPPTMAGAPSTAVLEGALAATPVAGFPLASQRPHRDSDASPEVLPEPKGGTANPLERARTNALSALPSIHNRSDELAAGFSLDWDYVYSDSSYSFASYTTTVVEEPVTLGSATFNEPSILKYYDGTSITVEGPTDFSGSGGVTMTSAYDNSIGDTIDWGFPSDGCFGPALVVQPDDYETAAAHCSVSYGEPGVVSSAPPISTVSVVATDPRATKGVGDDGIVTIVRTDGDWDNDLVVQLSLTGDAAVGADYESIGTTATIPAGYDGVDVPIHPLSSSGDFLKTLRITVVPDSGGTYTVGSPDGATVEIYNPAATAPLPASVPTGVAAWWRAEGDAADSLGTTPGLSTGFQLAPGLVGQAFDLDGVDQCVTVPSTAALNPSGSFTIEAWVFPRADQHSVIVGKWGWEGDYWNQRSFVLGPDTGRGVAFNISDAAHQWDGAFHAFTAPGVLTLNAWNHVAGVYDKSTGTRRIYVNGVQVGQRVDTPAITILSSSCKTAIGAYHPDSATTDSPFYGMIDEVANYNRALTATEIAAIATAHSSGKGGAPVIVTQPANKTAYIGNIATLTVTAYGALPLSYQWCLGGNAIGGATTSALTFGDLQPCNAGDYTVAVHNIFGTVVSATATLTVGATPPCTGAPANMTDAWPADGDPNDYIGGLQGTLINGAGYAPGKVGTAFTFSASAAQCVSMQPNSLLSPAASFTIEGWAFPNSDQTAVLFGRWGDSGDYSNQRSYVLYTGPNRSINFGISDSAHQWDGTFHTFGAANSLTIGAWNHIAAVYDQGTGTRRLYVNGLKVAERTDAPITVLNSTAKLSIGARYSSSSAVADPFDGKMDEFSLYCRALADSEVLGIYNASGSGKCCPTILTQPLNQAITYGSSVTFTVAAVGHGSLTYSWQRNGEPISGASSSSLLLPRPGVGDSGSSYCVIISDSLHSTPSAPALLTVAPALLSATANDKTAAAGNPIPPLDGTVAGVVTGDGISASFTTDATSDSPSGTYAITANWNDPNGLLPNYIESRISGTLTIQDAGAVAQPQLSLPGGSYPSIRPTTVTCATAGAEIHYTLNGQDPTTSDPAVSSGSAIQIPSALTLKVRAFKPGLRPSPTTTATYRFTGAIVFGHDRTHALMANGTLWGWGYNLTGALGKGDSAIPVGHPGYESVPVQTRFSDADPLTGVPNPLTGVIAVAAGEFHTIALRSDGTVFLWGCYVQHAWGTYNAIPAPVEDLPFVTKIAAGGSHNVAIAADNSVWTWGQYPYQMTTFPPTVVQNALNVVEIAAGSDFSLAVTSTGSLLKWGRAPGDLTAQQVFPAGISHVACYCYSQLALALRTDGTLAQVDFSTSPPTVSDPGLSGVARIACGQDLFMALRGDGSIWSWSAHSDFNMVGQFGDGYRDGDFGVLAPGRFNGVVSVAGGGYDGSVLCADGTVWTWGIADGGELGNGAVLSSAAPQSPPAQASINLLDSDGDGITDETEAILGLNPSAPDVMPPAFDPPGGNWSAAPVSVSMSCPTAGATIRYTLNGAEPTESSTAYTPGDPVTIGGTTTIKARAYKTGWTSSTLENQTYSVGASANQPPPVTLSPPAATTFQLSEPLQIFVDASDPDGSIRTIQLFLGDNKVAESARSPLSYTFNPTTVGAFAFRAKAIDNSGAETVSAWVTYTAAASASGPSASLLASTPFASSSPALLTATVTGIAQADLKSLTLTWTKPDSTTQEIQITPTVGEIDFSAAVLEGWNQLKVTAIDNQGHTADSPTVSVLLDTAPPTITITSPANNLAINASRINVTGTVSEANIAAVTVNGIPALLNGSAFEARNVPLEAGAHSLTAVASDLAGHESSVSISVTGTPDASGNLADLVQLQASVLAGFAGVSVTFTPQTALASGSIQQVLYDFVGDGASLTPAANLSPVAHIYPSAGQNFPVVTIVTASGRFSSIGGWNAPAANISRINVQAQPQQIGSPLAVSDPIDLKSTADGKLYVLSRSGAAIFEYDASAWPPTLLRSLSGIGAGSAPTGLDVDSAGAVYVALSGYHQVRKFTPTTASFQLDTTFGSGGSIGKSDRTSGSGEGQFSSPYDVAVMPDGSGIMVSDTGNNRIQQFASVGRFVATFAQLGPDAGELNAPKGVAYDNTGLLYVADTGNNRISLFYPPSPESAWGSLGAAPGQFHAPVNVTAGNRGLTVADTANGRVQQFDAVTPADMVPAALTPRWSISSELSLSSPSAIATAPDLANEKIYIADTGNNRVMLVQMPGDDPSAAWSAMVAHAVAGTPSDLAAAASCFSSHSSASYLRDFATLGGTDLASALNAIGTLTPVFISNDTAEYYFERNINGQTLLFPVEFMRENGVWKIDEF